MRSVVLCADETSLRHPEFIGLEGESLLAQPWLRCFSEAQAARDALLKAQEVEEVWVASNDEVNPINLAATLKSDRPDRRVFLVSFNATGSLLSRVGTAALDGLLGRSEFVKRYTEYKSADARRAQAEPSVAPMVVNVGQTSNPETKLVPTKMGKHASGTATEISGKHIGAVRREDAGRAGGFSDTPGIYQPPARVGVDRSAALMNAAMAVVQGEIGPRRGAAVDRAVITSVSDGGLQHDASQGAMALSLPKQAANQAFLLPVVSGSGGSGKSSIAALAALATHRAGLNTLLIDLDLQFGDMLEMLGCEEATCVDALLATPGRVKRLKGGERGPALLCAPPSIELAEDVIPQLPALLDLVMPNFDVVIVNTGSFWTDLQAVLLERCSRALFVVDQRPSSLKACQRALDLCTRCGIAASPLVFAVNKCSKQGLYSSIDVSCALNGACAKELAWGGSQVEEMLAAGQAIELFDMRNAFVESIVALMSELIPQMPEVDQERSAATRMSFLRMFMGRTREEQLCR